MAGLRGAQAPHAHGRVQAFFRAFSGFFRIFQGLGFRVQGLGLRVQDSGLGFRAYKFI